MPQTLQTGGEAVNEYQKRQARCDCLEPERRDFIKEAIDFANANDFGDGAFFAYMEENDIDVSELEAFAVEHDCASGRIDRAEIIKNKKQENNR